MFDPNRLKYDIKYYAAMTKELAAAGMHIISLKDMGGLGKPEAAKALVKILKDETCLPVHFHTHDTSGLSAASLLAGC